jgi:hypothetical protein
MALNESKVLDKPSFFRITLFSNFWLTIKCLFFKISEWAWSLLNPLGGFFNLSSSSKPLNSFLKLAYFKTFIKGSGL